MNEKKRITKLDAFMFVVGAIVFISILGYAFISLFMN